MLEVRERKAVKSEREYTDNVWKLTMHLAWLHNRPDTKSNFAGKYEVHYFQTLQKVAAKQFRTSKTQTTVMDFDKNMSYLSGPATLKCPEDFCLTK